MAKFVLVHGGGHGAWCWYKVVSRLKKAGHSAVAVDLTSCGTNNADPNLVVTIEEYSQPLTEVMQAIPDEEQVVLVGHSFGGVNLTFIMEKFPEKCAAAVFLVASMFPSGAEAAEMREKMIGDQSYLKHVEFFCQDGSEVPTSLKFRLESVPTLFYNLCSEEDIELAKLLLKPTPSLPSSEICVEHTSERYGQVPRFYIKTTQDQVSLGERQELYIQRNPPKHIFELASDHSPFFSMPDALVDLLLETLNYL